MRRLAFLLMLFSGCGDFGGCTGLEGVFVHEDKERGVTCWVVTSGISCLRDPVDGGGR